MAHKTLIGGTNYEITGGNVLIDSTNYEISSGKTLINGASYKISLGTPVSELAVGDSIYMNVNGVSTEFIVVNQGIPENSSLYDESCDGTWILMKDIYEEREWNSSNNNKYANSTINTYLNNDFLALFDKGIQDAIKTVKIPYGIGGGVSTVNSGDNGLKVNIFLLSGYEVGWTTSTNSYFPVDGACLSYFSGTSATDSKRIAYLNGTAANWWLRSPFTNNTYNAGDVDAVGGYYGYLCANSYGVRPALVLDYSAKVDNNNLLQE